MRKLPKYIQNYLDGWGLCQEDIALCEHDVCGGTVDDVHHIKYRSHGGSDEFDNLIGLCRDHHDWAHIEGSDSPVVHNMKRWPMGQKGQT